MVSGYMLDVVWFTLQPHDGFGQTYKQAIKQARKQISLLTLHGGARPN